MGGGVPDTSRQGNERMHRQSPNQSRGSRIRSTYENGKRGDMEIRGRCGVEDRGKPVNEAMLFQSNFKIPTDNGITQWRKFFAQVESPLRKWYQQRSTVDAAQKTIDKWDIILPYIENLMKAAATIFLRDAVYYLENDLDVHVWKYGIYQFIVILRGTVPPSAKYQAAVQQAYRDVFSRGSNHFKSLLIQVPAVLKIELDPILTRTGLFRGSLRSEELTVEENLVYRLFISLGDLYRYAFEGNKRPSDAKMASDMYNAARFCDTEKSRAYNQLAVVAKAQNDIIGTIYNFTRAWSAPVPADGARDQLLYLYDDIYKKFATSKNDFWYNLSKIVEDALKFRKSSRRELWISPLSQKKIVPLAFKYPLCKQDHINSLTENEVFSHFSLAFAHLLGKLYTKIGTENLEDVAKEVRIYFEGLILQKNSIKFSFLMEVIGLLLFMTDYLTPPESGGSPGATSQLKYMRDVTMRVTLNMISCLCEGIVKIVKMLDWDNPMLVSYVAAIHIWCRWAKRRSFVWSEQLKYWKISQSPVKLPEKVKVMLNENAAASFHRLYTEISVLLVRHSTYIFPKISCGLTKDCDTPIMLLPEQLFLDRFGDILLAKDYEMSTFYSDGRYSQERAQIHLRLSRISRFGKRIFGDKKSTPWMKQTENFTGASLEDPSMVDRNLLSFIQEYLTPTPKTFKDGSRPDCNNARIIVKKDLSPATDKKLRKYPKLPTSKVYELWSNLCAMGVKTEIVIRPVRVVLDTNCFIRHLEWVGCLLKLFPHPLYIPTAVVSELRGLARGLKPSRNNGKQLSLQEKQCRMIDSMVIADQCSTALDYLNEHRYNFTVVNTSGRKVKMYNFIKQKLFGDMLDVGVHNDEKILETCRQLEAKDESIRRIDTPFRIHRNTLLLTGDRSLRIRAYAADIPAREIQNLALWLLKTGRG
ncbi:unnamed protein product [Orchesella dallaii]|uniref:PIN domain-containing protein n=1 Tax=Orchesella dallaii TaxID=48710 RepID=A0ABP1RWT6_9HEXA